MERDVIISAYATPPPSAHVDAQPVAGFAHGAPLVVQVMPGSGANEAARFGDAASKLRDHTGSILKPLLRRALPKGDRARRVALVSFSAGWGFATAVINSPDSEWLDALILVDSLAFPRSFAGSPLYLSQRWQDFLHAAGSAGVRAPLVVSSTVTGIPSLSPLVGSTFESTTRALEVANETPDIVVPPKFELAKLLEPLPESWPISITGGNPPSTQVFPAPPEPTVHQVGNVVGCLYPGSGGPAHIFQAYHVQPRLFRTFLQPWWAAEPCEQAPVSGLGAADACALNRVAPPDVVGSSSVGETIFWLGCGAAAIATIHYLTRNA